MREDLAQCAHAVEKNIPQAISHVLLSKLLESLQVLPLSKAGLVHPRFRSPHLNVRLQWPAARFKDTELNE